MAGFARESPGLSHPRMTIPLSLHDTFVIKQKRQLNSARMKDSMRIRFAAVGIVREAESGIGIPGLFLEAYGQGSAFR